jgi:hypothetical protein
MGALWNLSESNDWQKPVAKSKFRCVIIKIGACPGFWKAALRITPCFRPLILKAGSRGGFAGTFPALSLLSQGPLEDDGNASTGIL